MKRLDGWVYHHQRVALTLFVLVIGAVFATLEMIMPNWKVIAGGLAPVLGVAFGSRYATKEFSRSGTVAISTPRLALTLGILVAIDFAIQLAFFAVHH